MVKDTSANTLNLDTNKQTTDEGLILNSISGTSFTDTTLKGNVLSLRYI